jgi:hypothetical protein
MPPLNPASILSQCDQFAHRFVSPDEYCPLSLSPLQPLGSAAITTGTTRPSRQSSDEARAKGWIVVDMKKNDWKTIFPPQH